LNATTIERVTGVTRIISLAYMDRGLLNSSLVRGAIQNKKVPCDDCHHLTTTSSWRASVFQKPIVPPQSTNANFLPSGFRFIMGLYPSTLHVAVFRVLYTDASNVSRFCPNGTNISWPAFKKPHLYRMIRALHNSSCSCGLGFLLAVESFSHRRHVVVVCSWFSCHYIVTGRRRFDQVSV
jgi:hypothetical protein